MTKKGVLNFFDPNKNSVLSFHVFPSSLMRTEVECLQSEVYHWEYSSHEFAVTSLVTNWETKERRKSRRIPAAGHKLHETRFFASISGLWFPLSFLSVIFSLMPLDKDWQSRKEWCERCWDGKEKAKQGSRQEEEQAKRSGFSPQTKIHYEQHVSRLVCHPVFLWQANSWKEVMSHLVFHPLVLHFDHRIPGNSSPGTKWNTQSNSSYTVIQVILDLRCI